MILRKSKTPERLTKKKKKSEEVKPDLSPESSLRIAILLRPQKSMKK